MKKGSYFIELAKIFKIQEIYSGAYKEMNKEWLWAKYFHTLKVVETGLDIISETDNFKDVSEKEYEAMTNALLMHDFARSHEKREDGTIAFKFHGAEGMQMAKESYDIHDPLVLAPILIHDQMTRNFIDLGDEDLKKDPQYTVLRPELQKSIWEVRASYQALSPKDKKRVDDTCALVKDADTLGNMKDYEIMFPLTKEPKTPEISPKVWDAVRSGEYVNYGEIKSLPDRALAYFAWAFKFSFSSTIRVAMEKDLFNKMKNHVVKEVREAQKEIPQLDEKLEKLEGSFDSIIHSIEKKKELLERKEEKAPKEVNLLDVKLKERAGR
ncbi:MAG: hypothetical protein EOM53_04160 [Alphaproteobacteria bacterium]|nr:hypothetical protein [Alphaproteobacteria bacterium]